MPKSTEFRAHSSRTLSVDCLFVWLYVHAELPILLTLAE